MFILPGGGTEAARLPRCAPALARRVSRRRVPDTTWLNTPGYTPRHGDMDWPPTATPGRLGGPLRRAALSRKSFHKHIGEPATPFELRPSPRHVVRKKRAAPKGGPSRRREGRCFGRNPARIVSHDHASCISMWCMFAGRSDHRPCVRELSKSL
jgi:hypothetical protein